MTAGRPRTRVVVVTGAPGVGKTEVGRLLVRRYDRSAALIDMDAMADVYPWAADERTYALMARNLRACLESYLEWGAEVVVITGVLLPGRLLDHVPFLLSDRRLRWVCYGLRASRAQLTSRVAGDPKVQEAEGRLSWSHLDNEVPGVPEVRQVHTDPLSLAEVVDHIAAREAAELAPRSATDLSARHAAGTARGAGRTVTVPVAKAREVCAAALRRIGFPSESAAATADELVAAERAGLPSHGLLRVPEYADAVHIGDIVPTARVKVVRRGPHAALLDAGHAPGTVVKRHLERELGRAATEGPTVVGLRAAGHLGRLATLGRAVAGRSLILMGFVNYSGGGRKVAPLGGTTGRWATNPLVFACPAPPGPAVVVDMSTSAVAEGTVRAALLAGEKLADGLLRGDDGRWINDPAQLYTEPPGAALAPLGGPAEHKGHALSAFVELMAGVVAGSGHVGAPRAFGNGGLFVSFPVDGLGKTPAEVGEAVVLLEEHLRQSPLAPGRATPRLPGRAVAHSSRSDVLRVPGDVWRAVGELAGYATVGGGEP